ncbi:MAG TPA: Ig-like domain-containing protein [Micromonosporaceae bacterium]
MRVYRKLLLLLGLIGVLTLAGCGGSGATWHGTGSSAPAKNPLAPAVTYPRDKATDVPTSAEITYRAKQGATTSVELTDGSGSTVDGSSRADGSSWVPAEQLRYGATYTLKVTAKLGDKSGTTTTTFTTMAKPANLVSVHSYLGDDETVGVGMPIVLTFNHAVAEDRRAAVQKRLFVTTEPAQEGTWAWFSPTEVHYRPKDYWQPGTRISLRAALGGLPLGGGWYGVDDLTVRASVGKRQTIEIDNTTKRLTFSRDGQVVKTMPVSLGKPAAPSSSGNMVVMIKNQWEWFDSSTYGVPVDSKDGYRTKVYWDMRLTWGGEYIHAAPWSVADQGVRNVSHGCVNLSTENAQWLFGQVQVGDPVTVKNTEKHLKWGDGWTDWDQSWDDYVKASALPPGTQVALSPAPTHS